VKTYHLSWSTDLVTKLSPLQRKCSTWTSNRNGLS
jgi:hypothetical protein